MGAQNTKIDTLKIPTNQIRANLPIQHGKFCPPFRKFSNPSMQITTRSLHAIVSLQQPSQEHIEIEQKYFKDLEDAFENKTKQLELVSVLNDEQYVDVRTFVGKDKDKDVTIQLRPFTTVNSHTFNNILYEAHINEEIAALGCPYLNTVQDKYIVETGLETEGQENPNTQVFVLNPVTTNLSEMIRFRREHNWPWTINQFNALAHQLCQALSALHDANISHNDIRPCNVFYSLEKNSYQLGCFANAVKMHGNFASVNQMRSSTFYGAPQLNTSKQANFQQADIYSLGMTLLAAFYLCEPIDRKAVADYNKKYENDYAVMGSIREMVMPIDKRSSISIISAKIPKGETSQTIKHLISSLQYKNSPKDAKLVATKKHLSEAYQRLGLWNEWKDKRFEAFELQENDLDDYRKANSLMQLSKIESCRGELESANSYAKSSSKIFRGLAYIAYEQGNIHQSMNLFTQATQCSKYFQNKYDIETAKNLQGLALVHCEKGDYEVAKPLIKESLDVVLKTAGRDSIDYCKVLITEAEIQTEFGEFENSEAILFECLGIAQSKIKINEEVGLRLKAQVLQVLGKNSLKWSQHYLQQRQSQIPKMQKYIADSILINQQFPNNHLAIAQNIDTFGELQLLKQNYSEAKNNFMKAHEVREAYNKENHSGIELHKESGDTMCQIAACQVGLGNYQDAIRNYNEGLQIYRALFGSDHNKFSAMAIGNMSKVYYKMNDREKAKQCLIVATHILKDELGEQDPDCEYFMHLLSTL